MRQIMRTLIIAFLILTFGIIHAQEQKRYFRIYTNVLQNIDISHPRLNVGIEKDFKTNQSLAVGFGFYYQNWMFNEPANGLILSSEYKRFKNNRLYFALGIDAGRIKYNTSGEFYYGNQESADSTYFEDYKIDKVLGNLYFNIGFRNNLGQKFYFDTYAGLGLRYKETIHLDRTRPEDEFKHGVYLVDIRDNPGQFFLPILKLGIIIGLKL
jgi:hypothetical protein